MKGLFLGIDLGTSSLKCGLWDGDGHCHSKARIPYATCVAGAVAEQDAGDHWRALVTGVREAGAGGLADRVIALGVGGHAPSPVLVDAALSPVAPVHTWMDTRRDAEIEHLQRALGHALSPGPERLTGHLAAALRWLARASPDRFARVRWALHPGDYLAARLVGGPITTSAGAAAVFVTADLSPGLLPDQAVREGAIAGPLGASAAASLGLPVGVPVIAGGLDAFLGVVGSGIALPGEASLNAGSSTVFSLVARPPARGRFALDGLPVVSEVLPRARQGLSLEAAMIQAHGRILADRLAQHGPLTRLLGIGGMTAMPKLNQRYADALGVPLEIPRDAEHSGALGAAMLAAVATGTRRDAREAAMSMVHVAAVYRPSR